MTALARRSWVPNPIEDYVQEIAAATSRDRGQKVDARLHALVDENRTIHDIDCVNLNPATNVMNPRAEALLARGLGRPSLGYPGDKYEMGLEAIERIEVIAAELAAETFGAQICRAPGRLGRARQSLRLHGGHETRRCDHRTTASIGGHISHHLAGVAGRYGVVTHDAAVDPGSYTIDVGPLRSLAKKCAPS